MMSSLNFLNVVPVFLADTDFAVAEIRRQFETANVRRFALCLSCEPIGYPARDTLMQLLAAARQIIDGVEGLPVEMGVLIQSTMGHGWSGPVPLTAEPWQHIVTIDGDVSSRMCPSDSEFRRYILFAVEEIMKLKPRFLLLDDDFGLRIGECFCENHIRLFNEAAARTFNAAPRSAAEVADMVHSRSADDPEVALFGGQRRELMLSFAKEIRDVVDRFDPAISCTLCCSFCGHYFANDAVKILAGAKGTPSARVNNAIYSANQPQAFYALTSQTAMIKYHLSNAVDVVDEADTFPQTYYSENAVLFHAHLTNAILCGLTGAKLWMSEFEQPENEAHQRKYERIFAENQGFYEELFQTVKQTSWQGVRHLLTHPRHLEHPLQASAPLYDKDWNRGTLGPFAVPVAYSGIEGDGIYALCESNVKNLSDEEIKRLFHYRLLVDSKAVRMLTERGFANDMGVRAAQDATFFFRGELAAGMTVPAAFGWDADMAKLETISENAIVRNWFVNYIGRGPVFEKVSPSMVFFKNDLGGRVATVGWPAEMIFYKVWRNQRRKFVLDALAFLNGDTPLDMVADVDTQVLVRHGCLTDGRDWAALVSLSLDAIPEIRLAYSKKTTDVQQLMPNGEWFAVPFEASDGMLAIKRTMQTAAPVILRFTTEE